MTDLMEPVAGYGPQDDGPALDVWAKVGVHLESLTAEMRQQRQQREQLYQDIRFIPVLPVQAAFTQLPLAFPVTVKLGFTWAVQRLTVSGFASATDTLSIYRGSSPADAAPNNLVNVLSESLYTWHPGRTGLLLKPNQTIVLGGGTSGSTYTVNLDVIQVADTQLPYFLL